MTITEKHLDKYLDGLDAFVDGRGFDRKHEPARQYVTRACHGYSIIEMLARMTTPTDGVTDMNKQSEILADLDDQTLCDDANTLYDLIRQAREITERKV